MTPEQKQEWYKKEFQTKREQVWERVSPEQKAAMREKRLEAWNQMSPEEREAMQKRREEAWQNLSPERRQQMQDAHRQSVLAMRQSGRQSIGGRQSQADGQPEPKSLAPGDREDKRRSFVQRFASTKRNIMRAEEDDSTLFAKMLESDPDDEGLPGMVHPIVQNVAAFADSRAADDARKFGIS